MDIVTVTLLVVLVCFAYYLATRNLVYFDKFGIPSILAWPLLGNTLSIFSPKHISEKVMNIYKAFPDAKYVGVFEFTRPTIMIRDIELIKRICIKNFDCFSDHYFAIDKDVDPLFGRNLFNMRGDHWRKTRNLVSPAFTSSKLRAMSELIIASAKNFTRSLAELPNDVKRMVDTKDLFSKFTMDCIASCAFGISVDSLKDPRNEFFVRCKKSSDFGTVRMSIKFMMATMVPWLMKLLKIPIVDAESTKFFIDVIQTSIQQRREKGISRPDVIQLFLKELDKDGEHSKLDYIDITAQAMIFVFGGLGTTSSHMCVIAHELALNNDIQKRLQEDIDEIMRISSENPSYEMISRMPYLDAVFNESIRRHSPVSFLDRMCVKPFELPPTLFGRKPFTVQPGMKMLIPAAAIHRNSQYYPNPDKFDPDRYYQKKVTINDTENLGFGIGPRGCIGNRLAIMETKILFFYLLYHFNLVPNNKTSTLQKYDPKTFEVRLEGGFWMSIESRNPTC